MLYPKTGLRAFIHLEIRFFVIQFTFAEKAHLSFDFISPQFSHFAEIFGLNNTPNVSIILSLKLDQLLGGRPKVVTGETVKFYSVTINKAYKEGEDWKYTNSFNIEDLPKVALVANEAYKHIRLKSTNSDE